MTTSKEELSPNKITHSQDVLETIREFIQNVVNPLRRVDSLLGLFSLKQKEIEACFDRDRSLMAAFNKLKLACENYQKKVTEIKNTYYYKKGLSHKPDKFNPEVGRTYSGVLINNKSIPAEDISANKIIGLRYADILSMKAEVLMLSDVLQQEVINFYSLIKADNAGNLKEILNHEGSQIEANLIGLRSTLTSKQIRFLNNSTLPIFLFTEESKSLLNIKEPIAHLSFLFFEVLPVIENCFSVLRRAMSNSNLLTNLFQEHMNGEMKAKVDVSGHAISKWLYNLIIKRHTGSEVKSIETKLQNISDYQLMAGNLECGNDNFEQRTAVHDYGQKALAYLKNVLIPNSGIIVSKKHYGQLKLLDQITDLFAALNGCKGVILKIRDAIIPLDINMKYSPKSYLPSEQSDFVFSNENGSWTVNYQQVYHFSPQDFMKNWGSKLFVVDGSIKWSEGMKQALLSELSKGLLNKISMWLTILSGYCNSIVGKADDLVKFIRNDGKELSPQSLQATRNVYALTLLSVGQHKSGNKQKPDYEDFLRKKSVGPKVDSKITILGGYLDNQPKNMTGFNIDDIVRDLQSVLKRIYTVFANGIDNEEDHKSNVSYKKT